MRPQRNKEYWKEREEGKQTAVSEVDRNLLKHMKGFLRSLRGDFLSHNVAVSTAKHSQEEWKGEHRQKAKSSVDRLYRSLGDVLMYFQDEITHNAVSVEIGSSSLKLFITFLRNLQQALIECHAFLNARSSSA